MTNKNSPLRIIDQKSTSTTPPPNATPTRYNPYTGGVIRQSREAGYNIFLQASSSWVKTTFTIKTENDATFARNITFSVRIPKLTVRITNPNVDINKLKIFLSFDKRVFDDYDDGEFKVSGDIFPNIVSFVTTSVTHVGPNNRTVGVYEATNNVKSLFSKYTVREILRSAGVVISLAELRSLSDDDIKDIFYKSMYSLRLYAQAMYQDLTPDNTNTSAEFLFRVPVSCAYSLTPDQLLGADISDVTASFENNVIIIRLRQIQIKSINIQVLDSANSLVYNASRSSGTDDFSDTKVVLRIPLAWLSNFQVNSVYSGFSSSTAPLTSLSSLYNLNSKYTIKITRAESNAGVVYTGSQITVNYGIPLEYTVNSPAFNESVRMLYGKHIINFVNGTWDYLLTTSTRTPFSGILVVYEINLTSNQTRFIPRFRSVGQPTSPYSDYTNSNGRFIKITDPFFQTNTGENTSRINIASIPNFDKITKVHFIPVSNYGRLSISSFVYNYNTIDLRRNVENSTLINGYYNKFFYTDRSKRFLMLQTNANALRGIANQTQVVVDVRLEVYRKSGTSWILINNTTFNQVYGIRVGRSDAIDNYYGLFNGNSPVNSINSQITTMRGAVYRFILVPKIPAQYNNYVAGGSGGRSYIFVQEVVA